MDSRKVFINPLVLKGYARSPLKSQGWTRSFILGIPLFVLLAFPKGSKGSREGDLPFPESHFATVDGVRYHYRHFPPQAGVTEKGTLLLIHGFASSTFSWRKLYMPLTRNGYTVLSVDIPPFGFSDRSPAIDHSPVANADRLWHLMGELGIDSLYIVGHSMGARVAGAMGAIHSQRARKVFLVDGPWYGSDQLAPARFLGRLLFNNPLMRTLFEKIGGRLASNRALVRRVLSFVYGERAGPEAVEGYMRPLRIDGTGYSLAPYFLEKARRSIPLKALRSPVHLIWGEKDRVLSERLAHRFLKRYPYETGVSVIEGAGHCPMETHPEAFLNVLLERMKGAP